MVFISVNNSNDQANSSSRFDIIMNVLSGDEHYIGENSAPTADD